MNNDQQKLGEMKYYLALTMKEELYWYLIDILSNAFFLKWHSDLFFLSAYKGVSIKLTEVHQNET